MVVLPHYQQNKFPDTVGNSTKPTPHTFVNPLTKVKSYKATIYYFRGPFVQNLFAVSNSRRTKSYDCTLTGINYIE